MIKKKSLPLPKLKKKLWKLVSERVRRRDADENGYVKCISCPKTDHWKNMDCGHYLKATFLGTWIDERNIHAQCKRCNCYLSGNESSYAIALRKKYGETILEDLESLKTSRDKYSRAEYEELIETNKNKLKSLDGFIFGAH